MKKQKGHGFIKDIITEDNYVFGRGQVVAKILQPSGD
ncbi:hypothetical protein LCGC14_1260490 [marine sediment metagenome]|uniref:Uncharacterized protein n=1 Tax=marine sediment metagenome TaxID=412755 RepID=A0A0F9L3C9_9ZZZZ